MAERMQRVGLLDLFVSGLLVSSPLDVADALFNGVAVATAPSTAPISRLSAALCLAADYDAMITRSPQDYRDVLVRVIPPSRLKKRNSMRWKLLRKRKQSALFDIKTRVADWERAVRLSLEAKEWAEPEAGPSYNIITTRRPQDKDKKGKRKQ
mmetsp:Transcript_73882/g.173470  ORF Transcript_73882/g.173470 Transcript_73882/m.173470 type:complete len:153 (-) Transcript_73882:9-467(-)